MSKPREDLRVKEIPSVVVDPGSNKKYAKGRFLGKGGFAKCYELTDLDTNIIYAGKIVSKALLQKPHQKDKMTMEIAIHKSLTHPNVVGFHGFFEDDSNVYVLLELCRRRSLMELHKRRKAVTEPEARYFMRQIILAVQYMHGIKVIHRDLKLGNLFLNDEMEVKVGDFGLATKVGYDGERKRTLCGTPNYIAPEVLSKKGHSYEVDSWSLGCIMFTLLVGKPPFETTSLKETYMRIKKNEYHIPSRVSTSAKSLITRMLKNDPKLRPSITTILHDEFFVTGLLPAKLPTTCLTMAPRFAPPVTRKPLLEVNGQVLSGDNVPSHVNSGGKPDSQMLLKAGMDENGSKPHHNRKEDKDEDEEENSDYHLPDMLTQLTSVLAALPSTMMKHQNTHDEAEDPAAIPVLWISKWVDYSDKYGLGYQLCDGSVGVLFNDSTRLLLQANGENLEYIDRSMKEHFHTFKEFPENLTKKVTLLKYFRNYMMEHLLKAGAAMVPRDSDNLVRLPYLTTWLRTRSGIVLHLSNGTLQINFFADHTKVIICPLMGAITYIDNQKEFRTFRLNMIEQYGCRKDLVSRIKYSRTMVERLIEMKSANSKAHKHRAVAQHKHDC